ncbi:MAG TPA: bifunctional oligoribonuclease/PAP phosphatase NrnA [Alphaproteobacteria bacterium]|jgi:phosphoesterase RecJ-like protein|nr:bifunctional oligoribonuclease/PAP phosphatase NrnA [Alphaproteobacteria bacterium]
MNYKESKLILEEIKKAKRIILNCHKSPDPDSIGSALATRQVLLGLGKEVEVVCPSEELPQNLNYLNGFSNIKTGVDFGKLDYSKFDLFLTLDSSSWDQVTGLKDNVTKKIKIITIDHHLTSTKYGYINLLDSKITSTGELLFSIFEDWKVKISKNIADCLMCGIVGDTGAFRYPGAGERTFEVASKLMKLGADKDKAVHILYRSEPYELIKFYGETLTRVQIDKKHKFVWSAIPYEIYDKLGKPAVAKEAAASLFAQVVEGTDFGFIAVEKEKGELSISFRSRTGFNTSEIAVYLGGGGHIYASGARINGLPFDDAVEKVLAAARKFASKHK